MEVEVQVWGRAGRIVASFRRGGVEDYAEEENRCLLFGKRLTSSVFDGDGLRSAALTGDWVSWIFLLLLARLDIASLHIRELLNA